MLSSAPTLSISDTATERVHTSTFHCKITDSMNAQASIPALKPNGPIEMLANDTWHYLDELQDKEFKRTIIHFNKEFKFKDTKKQLSEIKEKNLRRINLSDGQENTDTRLTDDEDRPRLKNEIR